MPTPPPGSTRSAGRGPTWCPRRAGAMSVTCRCASWRTAGCCWGSSTAPRPRCSTPSRGPSRRVRTRATPVRRSPSPFFRTAPCWRCSAPTSASPRNTSRRPTAGYPPALRRRPCRRAVPATSPRSAPPSSCLTGRLSSSGPPATPPSTCLRPIPPIPVTGFRDPISKTPPATPCIPWTLRRRCCPTERSCSPPARGRRAAIRRRPASSSTTRPPTPSPRRPPPATPAGPCFTGRLLVVPNGHVLFSSQSGTVAVYNPGGSPDPSWRPVVTSVPPIMAVGHHYLVSGQQFNGLSQACYYGDDATMATNYPIARLKKGAKEWYCRTAHHSTMGIATGTSTVTTVVAIPAAVPPGDYQFHIIANGIESLGVPVKIVPAMAAIAVDVQDGGKFGTVCGVSYLDAARLQRRQRRPHRGQGVRPPARRQLLRLADAGHSAHHRPGRPGRFHGRSSRRAPPTPSMRARW